MLSSDQRTSEVLYLVHGGKGFPQGSLLAVFKVFGFSESPGDELLRSWVVSRLHIAFSCSSGF